MNNLTNYKEMKEPLVLVGETWDIFLIITIRLDE